MRKVRLGFIGCGMHATNDLYPNIAQIPELELVATCDLVKELAERNARLYGASNHYTNFERMLSEEELDAVIIVGSPKLHTELGIACLEHGVHIFVEKPPAISLGDAKQLAETADRVGKFGQVGHMMRFATAHQLAKRIINVEEFGSPILMESKFFTSTPWEPRTTWGVSDLDWTYMLVQGIHSIDIAIYFMGEVVSVGARRCVSEKTGRQAFAVNLQFKTGAIGILNLASSSPYLQTRIEITSDLCACLCVDNMNKLRYEQTNSWAKSYNFDEPNLAKSWENPLIDDSNKRIGFLGEMKHFAHSILSNTEPSPNLWDGYKAMLIAQAIIESTKSGKTVQMSYTNYR